MIDDENDGTMVTIQAPLPIFNIEFLRIHNKG